MNLHGGHRIQDVGAVLFDAGFTLLEPIRSLERIYTEAARELGAEIDEARLATSMARAWESELRHGHATDLSSSDAIEHAGWLAYTRAVAEPFPSLAQHHQAWLARLVSVFDRPETWRPVAGALDVLERARDRGWRVGIVSNWHSALLPILAHHGFIERCDFVICSALFGRRKPHIEIFLEAARRAGVPPERCVFVGDSLRDDVEGAGRAGMTPIHIAGGGEASCVRQAASVAMLHEHLPL